MSLMHEGSPGAKQALSNYKILKDMGVDIGEPPTFQRYTVYFLSDSRAVKIGKVGFPSRYFPDEPLENIIAGRIKTLQTGNPFKIELIYATSELNETETHRKFQWSRLNGEWFKPTQELRRFIHEHSGKEPNPWPDSTLN